MGFVLPAGNSSGNLGAANLLPAPSILSKAKPGPGFGFKNTAMIYQPGEAWIWLHLLLDSSSTLSGVFKQLLIFGVIQVSPTHSK